MRPEAYGEPELWRLSLEFQEKNPKASEAELCAHLKVASNYFRARAKHSESIAELKGVLFAMREAAWIREGVKALNNRSYNNLMFVWMTKNVLKWREDAPGEESEADTPAKADKPLTLEETQELVRKVREEMKK